MADRDDLAAFFKQGPHARWNRLRLDRRMAERRTFPAVDVAASSTRHEELLFDRKQLAQVWKVRRAMNALASGPGGNAAALERLLDGMKQFKSLQEFLDQAAKVGAAE